MEKKRRRLKGGREEKCGVPEVSSSPNSRFETTDDGQLEHQISLMTKHLLED